MRERPIIHVRHQHHLYNLLLQFGDDDVGDLRDVDHSVLLSNERGNVKFNVWLRVESKPHDIRRWRSECKLYLTNDGLDDDFERDREGGDFGAEDLHLNDDVQFHSCIAMIRDIRIQT